MISVQQEVCRHLHRTLQENIIENNLPARRRHQSVASAGRDPHRNPATMVHYVLVMSVNPGFGACQKFIPLPSTRSAYLADLRAGNGPQLPHRSSMAAWLTIPSPR